MKKQILETENYSPLYKQLMQKLRADINAGIYPVHSRIPSEQELCETYDVSRVTVRKALTELTQEGLLNRHQGKGTFVGLPKIRKDLQHINSFRDACRLTNCTPSSKVLRAALVRPEPQDAESLALEEGSLVLEVERLRLADNVPIMLETNRFPERFEYLLAEDLTGSVYAILNQHGVHPGQAIHDISLCYASPMQARQLGVEPGQALLYLHEIIFDQNGQPLHISEQYIRGDRFTFRI